MAKKEKRKKKENKFILIAAQNNPIKSNYIKAKIDNMQKEVWIMCLFGLVWFYGISTIVGYLMPNPLYTYILNIYDLVWLGFMAYQPLLVI